MDRVASIARVGVLYALLLTGSVVLGARAVRKSAYALFLPAGSAAWKSDPHQSDCDTSFIFFGITMVLFGVVRGRVPHGPLITLTVAVARRAYSTGGGVS